MRLEAGRVTPPAEGSYVRPRLETTGSTRPLVISVTMPQATADQCSSKPFRNQGGRRSPFRPPVGSR